MNESYRLSSCSRADIGFFKHAGYPLRWTLNTSHMVCTECFFLCVEINAHFIRVFSQSTRAPFLKYLAPRSRVWVLRWVELYLLAHQFERPGWVAFACIYLTKRTGYVWSYLIVPRLPQKNTSFRYQLNRFFFKFPSKSFARRKHHFFELDYEA